MADKFPDVRKIACLRAGRLGDFIVSLPALAALRQAYPDAEICVLGTPADAELLDGRLTPVDRVIVAPAKHGVHEFAGMVEDEAELEAFFQRMRDEHFDLAIQMHGGGRNSNPFLLRLGARHTVGMRTSDAALLDRWMPYVFWQNEIVRAVEVVQLCGADASLQEPELSVTDRDRDEVRQRLPEVGAHYVVLHAGAGDPRRRWPPDRFAAVGDALAADGYQVVLIGTGDERQVVEQVAAQMRYPSVSAFERLSLGGLVGLMSGAALVVSNDTGPLHVALAAGAPTVGLFWCGNYLNWSHLQRSTFRPLVSWVTHCLSCGADLMPETRPPSDCAHPHCLVDAITPDQVIDAALSLTALDERMPG